MCALKDMSIHLKGIALENYCWFLTSVVLDPPLFFFFLRLLRDLELLVLPVSGSVLPFDEALFCVTVVGTAGAPSFWVVVVSSVILNLPYVAD